MPKKTATNPAASTFYNSEYFDPEIVIADYQGWSISS